VLDSDNDAQSNGRAGECSSVDVGEYLGISPDLNRGNRLILYQVNGQPVARDHDWRADL
jgi:hypothetical protein